MKKAACILLLLGTNVFASTIIPVGNDNNVLYYKIGGGSDFSLPPVSDTDTIRVDTNANLSMGYSCSAFNPALSISNSLNELRDSLDNLTRDIIGNATGSLMQMPLYELARSNPTLYALFNNQLLFAHNKLNVSTKSCEVVKQQISQGQNPYQDWATLAVNDQWKKKLSLISSGDADINHAKKEIDEHSGDEGVAWVNGDKDSDGTVHAGGKAQPPVHVIADTVKSGYNAMLNRNLENDSPALKIGPSFELANYFPTPQSAMNWITNVVGDQTITTCNDNDCKKKQSSIIGHGLLPWMTSCNQDKDNCVDTLRLHLGNLVTGNESLTKENLEKVSTDGIMISPEILSSIRSLDRTQQTIIVNKLAQEIAIQRVIDKALIARNLLSTGAQVPVIAANHPAQVIIDRAITHLDNDIRSLTFESQVRKQMMSDTLSHVLNFSSQQQRKAMSVAPASLNHDLMEGGAVSVTSERK